MGFLGILGLGRIETRLLRHVASAELVADGAACGIDRFRCHLHTVGTHIGDQTDGLATDIDTLVKSLRHLHGPRGGETEARRRGLLQRGRGEGRAGIALDGLCLDGVDNIARAFEQGL